MCVCLVLSAKAFSHRTHATSETQFHKHQRQQVQFQRKIVAFLRLRAESRNCLWPTCTEGSSAVPVLAVAGEEAGALESVALTAGELGGAAVVTELHISVLRRRLPETAPCCRKSDKNFAIRRLTGITTKMALVKQMWQVHTQHACK